MFLRKIACYCGFHSYEWRSDIQRLNDGVVIETTSAKCRNLDCREHRWVIMDRTKRLW